MKDATTVANVTVETVMETVEIVTAEAVIVNLLKLN